ncbi:hypothetical protein BFW01_g3036 [Lasiodiplodia theobromae]|nr:hypothetical protein BFW01_g3036 [Lasiodiplodia theobromae]
MASSQPEGAKGGHKPNYVNPENQIPLLVGVQTPMLALMLLIVAARFFDRAYNHIRLDASDWLTILAFVFVITCNIIPLAGIATGVGRHTWDIKEEWKVINLKLTFAFRISFSIAAALIKIAVMLFYMRMFPHSKANIWFCRCMIGFCAFAAIAFIFITTFACSPPSDYWNAEKGGNRNCHNESKILLSASCQKLVTEFLVFAWPSYFIWKLKLPRMTRVSLGVLFSLGIITSFLGLIKTGYLWYSLNHPPDFPWTAARVFMIECLEINLCLLCGCLPHIKRPFKIICCCLCRRRRNHNRNKSRNRNRNRNRKPRTPEIPHDKIGLFGPQPRQPPPLALRGDLDNRRNGVVFRSFARSFPRTVDDDDDDAFVNNPTPLMFESGNDNNVTSRRINGSNPPPPTSLVGPRLSTPPPDFDDIAAIAMDRLQRSSSLAMTSPQLPPKTPKRHHQQKQQGQAQTTPRLPRSPGSMNMVALREEAEAHAHANNSPYAARGGSEE